MILFGWPKIVEFGFSDVEYVLEKLKEWRLRKRRKKNLGRNKNIGEIKEKKKREKKKKKKRIKTWFN